MAALSVQVLNKSWLSHATVCAHSGFMLVDKALSSSDANSKIGSSTEATSSSLCRQTSAQLLACPLSLLLQRVPMVSDCFVCQAVSQDIAITDIRLEQKSGGRSRDYQRGVTGAQRDCIG